MASDRSDSRKRRCYDDLWDSDEESRASHSKRRRASDESRRDIEKRDKKERERERERTRERDREREKEREREKDRDRDRKKHERDHKNKHKEESHARSRDRGSSDREKSNKEAHAEEQHKQRVEEQMKQIAERGDDEEELRKRREKRQAMLDKLRQGALDSPTQQTPPPLETSPVEKEAFSPIFPDGTEQAAPENQVSPKDTPTDSEPSEEKFQLRESDMFEDLENTSNLFLENSDEKKSVKAIVHGEADDEEGYYCHRHGELLNGGKYIILGSYGRGVFSTVLKAKDQTGAEVAIKVLRNNDLMRRTGMKEIQTLKDLAGCDSKNSCVRLLDNFEENGHLCLVFEPLPGGNLRDVLKKYGTNVGLNIKAVRLYAQKLMLALYALKKARVIHSDIKPDNILVNESKTNVKLADFGSAFPLSENTLTPYLQSRWYRAPEIILGLPGYTYAVDMWSMGCCLYEIFTGDVLFRGNSNNEMLYLFMQVTGGIPKKFIKKGAFSSKHFDDLGNLKRIMKDKIDSFVKVCSFTKPTRDLKEEMLNSGPSGQEEKRDILNLQDLLSKIFVIDPSHRITVEEALRHPFICS